MVIILIFAITAMLILFTDDTQATTPSTPIPSGPIPDTTIDDSGNGGYDFGPGDDSGTILYSVYSKITTNLYLRSISFGDYTGSGWKSAPVYDKLIDDTYAASYLTALALAADGQGTNTVTLKSYTDSYVLPYYAAIGDNIQTDDTSSEGDSSQPYTINFYNADLATLQSAVKVTEYELAYREFVYDNYLAIDEETRTYMESIIKQEGFSRENEDIIEAVSNYIRGAATYNLDFDTAMEESDNVVISFLEDYKEGVCRHYAAAATMLYRSLGIPARFTLGTLAKAQANQWVDVPSSQSHAWVEVYLDGVGWIMVEVTGSTPNGNIDNEPDFDKTDLLLKPTDAEKRYDGTTLYPDGTVNGFEALSELGFTYDANISGQQTTPGISDSYIDSIIIYDINGNDVTDYFNITTQSGSLRVYMELYLNPTDAEKRYDGTPLSPDSTVVGFDEAFALGFTYNASISGEQTDPGFGDSYIDEITIFDRDGYDATAYFNIYTRSGSLYVYYDSLIYRSSNQAKVYDGEPVDVDAILESGELREGDHAEFVSLSGTEIGIYANRFDVRIIEDATGEDVTYLYKIEGLSFGTLRICYSTLEFYGLGGTVIYTGKSVTLDVELLGGWLAENHKPTCRSSIGTEVGTYPHLFDVQITDTTGQDVTDLYIIRKYCYNVNIVPISITLKADDAEKVYDGTALECSTWTITKGSLADGHYIADVVIEGSRTDPGKTDCIIVSFRIVDAQGNDVTANYIVDTQVGTLRVNPPD